MQTIPESIPQFESEKKYHYIKTSPIDGEVVCEFYGADENTVSRVCEAAYKEFLNWSKVPPPKRVDLLTSIYNSILNAKEELVDCIQTEVGKIREEAVGEIQEALDIINFCIGLCRTLEGRIFPSERINHFMFEQWHPLGVCGVITAFNFPVAVFSWNAFLAITCGNSVVWKPSELAPKTAYTFMKILKNECEKHGLGNLICAVFGGPETGSFLVENNRTALISATGSVRMGSDVAQKCAKNFKKVILELGGNNAVIVHKDANLDLAVNACFFGIVGTSGQRCTSIRRLILHKDVFEQFMDKMIRKLEGVVIGDPRDPKVMMGPLISDAAALRFEEVVHFIKNCTDSEILYGGKLLDGFPVRNYVQPTLVKVNTPFDLINNETFAPIVYCFEYEDINDAITLNNSVPQGLSSAIFTDSLQVAFTFLGGSDCGLANVNTSTSGAEIGLAFGGEKQTGGGREAGSDSWKNYMRRQSCVVNWGGIFTLSQNINFPS